MCSTLHAALPIQALSGASPTSEDPATIFPSVQPLICTSGLATLAALWLAVAEQGGADVLIASTAYEGSSELLDILIARSTHLRKCTFDVHGTTNLVKSLRSSLSEIVVSELSVPDHAPYPVKTIAPHTMVFVEVPRAPKRGPKLNSGDQSQPKAPPSQATPPCSQVPTNREMKVPCLRELAAALRGHREASGRQLTLMLDTTFAPNSQVAPSPLTRGWGVVRGEAGSRCSWRCMFKASFATLSLAYM